MDKTNAKWFLVGLLAATFLTAFVAWAFSEGDIISRATFTQQDFSEQALECQHEGNTINFNKRPLMLEIWVSCLSASILDDENIIVERWKKKYEIRITGQTEAIASEWTQPEYDGILPSIKQCVQEGYTPIQCWNNLFKQRVIDLVKEERDRIRVYLNNLRDPNLPAEINPNDFTLTTEELNE